MGWQDSGWQDSGWQDSGWQDSGCQDSGWQDDLFDDLADAQPISYLERQVETLTKQLAAKTAKNKIKHKKLKIIRDIVKKETCSKTTLDLIADVVNS